MQYTEFLLAELERETPRSRRALEQMPEGQSEWKPHERSMAFGYLCELVATMPTWIVLAIDRDELDIAPASGSNIPREPLTSRADYLRAHDKAVDGARAALRKTTDEHLATKWRLLARGTLAFESPRHVVIADTLNHLAHHRGQMTVYLRLLEAKVPSIYGPSADDQSFG